MISVPGNDKGIDDDKVPLEAIRKMTAIFRILSNKVPSIRIGPWIGKEKTKDKLLQDLPEDVDVTERYIFDFNWFISPGSRAYCQGKVYYGSKTTIAQIESFIQGFKKPRV